MSKPRREGQLLLLVLLVAVLCLYAGFLFARVRSTRLPEKGNVTHVIVVGSDNPYGWRPFTPEQRATLARLVEEERAAIENDIRSDARLNSAKIKVHARIEWDKNGVGEGHILIAGKAAAWQKRIIEEIERKHWAILHQKPYDDWIGLKDAIGVL